MTGAVLAVAVTDVGTAAALLSLLWFDRYGEEAVWPFLGAAVGAAAARIGLDLLVGWAMPQELAMLRASDGAAMGPWQHATGEAVAVVLVVTLAVVILCPPARFPGLVEPLVMGALAGLGAGSTGVLLAQTHPPLVAVSRLLWLAVAGAWNGVLVGWGRGGGGWTSRGTAALAVPLAGAGAAMAGWWLTSHGDGGELVAAAALPPALLVVAVLVAVTLERQVIRTALTREVALGVLPGWVVQAAASFRQRAFGGWWEPRQERRVVAEVLVKLAFRSWVCQRAPVATARLRGLEVGRLRQRARELLRLREHADVSGEER